MNIVDQSMALEGYYTLTKRKAATLEIVQELEFPNLITNVGINRLGSAAAYDACFIGTGNTAPLVTDTRLSTYFARSSSLAADSHSNGPAPTYYCQRSRTYRFAAGVAGPSNIAEVGVGVGANEAAHSLFSRALILDSSGNPTTISILADEILDVTYSLRLYPDMTDRSLSFTVNGVAYTGTIRPSKITSWLLGTSLSVGTMTCVPYANVTALGPVTSGQPGNQLSGPESKYQLSYTAESFYRDTVCEYGLGNGNHANGISGFNIQPDSVNGIFSAYYQTMFSPSIPKTSASRLTMTFRVSWTRYAP